MKTAQERRFAIQSAEDDGAIRYLRAYVEVKMDKAEVEGLYQVEVQIPDEVLPALSVVMGELQDKGYSIVGGGEGDIIVISW